MPGGADGGGTRAREQHGVWRTIQTVGVWILIVSAFAGLGYGIFILVQDGFARLDETRRSVRSRTSIATAAEPVVAPGIGETPLPPGIVAPRWLILPNPEYPLTGSQMVSGSVALLCQVEPTGGLRDCRILEETPQGRGFGEAAVQSTQEARLTPRTVDGEPTAGEVRFRIRFSPR